MGRAKRWLRSLLGGKKETHNANKVGAEPREKRRWSFTKPSREIESETTTKTHVDRRCLRTSNDDVAAAARLKSHGNGLAFRAAVKIQTAFRGSLARKALRALKALVKLQALVRGCLVRRRAAAALRGMQALVRAQAMARSQRVRTASRRSLERFDDMRSEYLASPSFRSRRLSAPYESYDSSDSPKILEVDPGRPRSRIQKLSNLKASDWADDCSSLQCSKLRTRLVEPSDWGFFTAQCTPRVITPSKSTFPGIYRHGNSEHPSYMAKTQSFKAKIRSQSAPKQRPEPKKRVSLAELVESRSSLSGIGMQRSCSKAQEAVAFRVERSSELSRDCYVRDYHFHGRW